MNVIAQPTTSFLAGLGSERTRWGSDIEELERRKVRECVLVGVLACVSVWAPASV
jgi:hypothetical protein